MPLMTVTPSPATRLRLTAGVLPLLLAGCGPGPTEAGAAMLTMAPIIIGLSGILLWLVWAPLEASGRGYPWGAVGTLSGLALLGTVVGAIVLQVHGFNSETLMLALLLGGTSYLAVAMVAWRIWRFVAPDTAVVGGLLVAIVITFLPAVPLLFDDEGTSFAVAAFYLWIYGGFIGWVPGGLAVLLWIEAGVRRLLRGPQRAQ